MFSFIYACINNREAGDLRRQDGHYDVIVIYLTVFVLIKIISERGNCWYISIGRSSELILQSISERKSYPINNLSIY